MRPCEEMKKKKIIIIKSDVSCLEELTIKIKGGKHKQMW